MDFLPTTTSREEADRKASVAVLPIGSFEQHRRHLPLATDTVVACAIADSLATEYGLLLLPPVSFLAHMSTAGSPAQSASVPPRCTK